MLKVSKIILRKGIPNNINISSMLSIEFFNKLKMNTFVKYILPACICIKDVFCDGVFNLLVGADSALE